MACILSSTVSLTATARAPGSTAVHLGHHVLDGTAAAEGRQLDEAHRVPFVEVLLDPR